MISEAPTELSLETKIAIEEFIEDHGELGSALLYNFNNNIDNANKAMNNYQGEFDNEADYAEELYECAGYLEQLPDTILPYINYEKIARDLQLNRQIFVIRTDEYVHIFRAI